MSTFAPGEWDWLNDLRLAGLANVEGGYSFVPGTSDTLDWLNFLGPGAASAIGGLIGGPAGAALGGGFASELFGFLSQQRAQDKARDAQRAANQANEARFLEMLRLNTQAQNLAQQQFNQTGQFLFDRIGRAMADLAGAGQQAMRDISARETAQMGAATQDLQRRGLGNTTLLNSARRAIAADANRARAGVTEGVAGLRANIRGGMERDLADFMQRRTQGEVGLLQDRSGLIERRQDVSDLTRLLPLLAQPKKSGDSGGGLFGKILGGVGKILGGIFD